MSQNKELEIQLQFLDEAQEYLATLETSLLGLSAGVEGGKVNAALRAAHSIKGGAALMGFQTLSQLAHRLEDSLKVLKVQKNQLVVDGDLERLMLTGVDGLCRLIESDRRSMTRGIHPANLVNPPWIDTQINPVFEQLHDRLGDPQDEDAHSILSLDEGQDVVVLLFQTEVEGCLQRLEAVLDANDPQLRDEVNVLAQELEGLGEMLQLPAFCALCRSIAQFIADESVHTLTIAQLALDAWRQSQAFVLTGQLESLPDRVNQAELFAVEEALTTDFFIDQRSVTHGEDLDHVKGLDIEDLDTEALDIEGLDTEALGAEDWDAIDSFAEMPLADLTATELVEPTEELIATDFVVDSIESVVESDSAWLPDGEPILETTSSPPRSPRSTRLSAVGMPEVGSADAPQGAESPEASENTVRVPMRQLDQLNDLFGELTIQRNGLNLNLKRMRTLVQSLSHRIQVLEQSNSHLRTAYDRVAMQTTANGAPFNLDAAVNGDSTLAAFDESQHANLSSHSADWQSFDVLELDRYSELHLLSQEVMEIIVQIQEITSDVDLGLEDTEQTSRELTKTTKQLQTKLTQVRMRPLSDILDRFPRALRDLSLQYGKSVRLKLFGSNTLIDRNILEVLNDPLMHLLRNAFDHGIEDSETRRLWGKPDEGTIEIRAWHQNNRTLITLRDDGGGIPLDKIRSRAQQMGLDEVLLSAATDEELLTLIFEPGFSTASEVTALSGRGVGMDVVRSNLKQIRGDIKVDTEAGVGTTFTIAVPFTLSITRVLLAQSNGMMLAFPADVIEETVLLDAHQVVYTAGGEAIGWNDTVVELVRLARWLEFRCPQSGEGLETAPTIAAPLVLMLKQGEQVVGIQVDRCWGEQEVAIRKVEGNLPMPPGFNTCTILGDGRVVPLVNVSEMLHWIASYERSPSLMDFSASAHAQLRGLLPAGSSAIAQTSGFVELPPMMSTSMSEQRATILVVDDSINVRRLLALTLEKAGYLVMQAKDGQDAIDKLVAGLQVQAIICDIEMPRLDGYGFLARLKSNPAIAHLPVTMLTSRSNEKHQRLAIKLGAVAYFSKPYNEQALLQSLDQLIHAESHH